MKVVSVATVDSRAYYSILSRLKRTNLRFVSVTLSQAAKDQRALIITTRKELGFFDGNATSIPIEELDEDPLIMEGQILSRILNENKRSLLIGVDPGLRIGLVIFYGRRRAWILHHELDRGASKVHLHSGDRHTACEGDDKDRRWRPKAIQRHRTDDNPAAA